MGKFFSQNVQPGNYYIFSSLTPQSQFFYDYFPTYFGDAVTWSGAALITLGETQNPYDIHMVPVGVLTSGPGAIHGTITMGEGKADPGTNITVMLMDENENTLAFTQSDSEGHFIFENLAYQTYKLKVEIPGKPSAIATVSLNENNPEGDITFIVKIAEVTLTEAEIREFASFIGELYPNPLNDKASIRIDLVYPSVLSLRIINQLGMEVQSSALRLEKRSTND